MLRAGAGTGRRRPLDPLPGRVYRGGVALEVASVISALYWQRFRLATAAFLVLAVSAGLGYLTYRLLSDAGFGGHRHPVPTVTVTATTAPSSAPATGHVPPPTLTPTPPVSPVPTVTQFIAVGQGGSSWAADIAALGTAVGGVGGVVTAVAAVRALRRQPAVATSPATQQPPAATTS
jgi:hypothetical protein